MERFSLPYHTLTPLALFWCCDNPEMVLVEDVLNWLNEYGIAYEIGYSDESDYEEGECDYHITFTDHYGATAFKMRWL